LDEFISNYVIKWNGKLDEERQLLGSPVACRQSRAYATQQLEQEASHHEAGTCVVQRHQVET
jgi:hypothetical protein